MHHQKSIPCGATGGTDKFMDKPFTSGFIFNCSGSKELIQSLDTLDVRKEYFMLFEYKFDKDHALLSDDKLLFKMARQCLMLLAKKTLHSSDSSKENKSSETSIHHLRNQIGEFFTYIYDYFESLSTDPSFTWLLEKLLPSITEKLTHYFLLVRTVWYDHLNSAEAFSTSYHKFHAHLEICCHNLEIVLCLVKCQKMVEYTSDVPMLSFEKYIYLFISDLLLVEITLFRQLSLEDLQNNSPFSCSCVKHVWTKLRRVLDSFYEADNQKEPFWTYVNTLLNKVTAIPLQNETSLPNQLLTIPNYYTCEKPEIFQLWLISHLAALYKRETVANRDNYIQVESLMKVCIAPDCHTSESEVQTIILLVAPLTYEYWAPKSEVIMILWEYFHRRLNLFFLKPKASLDGLQIICRTSVGWLETIKARQGEHFKNDDSWGLFLRVLGLYLKNSQKKQQHQVLGRIYSKFSPAKLHGLTELGLYRFSSLFLTICISTDIEEVSTKLQSFMELVNHQDCSRRVILWRTHLALINLHMEQNMDIKTISQPLRNELANLSEKQDTASTSLVKEFITELQNLAQLDSFLKLSGHVLLNKWMSIYLSSYPEADATSLLYDILLSLIMKLQSVGEEFITAQHNELAETLWQHVLPFIFSGKSTNTGECEGLLCYQLTVLAIRLPANRSVGSLFCRFVNSPTVNVKILCKYVSLLMTDHSAMEILKRMERYQGLIVRAWLRCKILSLNGKCSNLISFTQQVSELPEMVELSSGGSFLSAHSDSLVAFLKVIASARGCLTERVHFYLSTVEIYLTRTSMSSASQALRVYLSAAAFIEHASQLIYTSTQSKTGLFNAIISRLLLPPSIYSGDLCLNAPEQLAIGETLHLFIRGLVGLKLRSDPYINMCLKDLVIQYFPRLASTRPNTMQDFIGDTPTMLHPLLKSFDDIESEIGEDSGRLVLEVLSTNFLSSKSKTKTILKVLALDFVNAILNKWNGNKNAVKLITDCALGSILEMLMFSPMDQASVVTRKGNDILRNLLVQTDHMRDSQASVLIAVIKDNLAFSASFVFRLLERLVGFDSQLVRVALPGIRDLVKIVEQKRNVDYDRGLRSGLEKIDKLLI